MNSRVIKCVAGAGKTTRCKEEILPNSGQSSLYLAYTNSVVDEMMGSGFLAKTIDALFFSYIFPKFSKMIPLMRGSNTIRHIDEKILKNYERGVCKLHIDIKTGQILYGSTPTTISLETNKQDLYSGNDFKYSKIIKKAFNKDGLSLTNALRDDLAGFIICNYSDLLIEILAERFPCIIFDESQDLHGYKEDFAKIVYNSNIRSFFLGDDNQNILSRGGKWFEGLESQEYLHKSWRCPEQNCKWIRENLGIKIFGLNVGNCGYFEVKLEDVLSLNDGKRVLLYNAASGKIKDIKAKWLGPTFTIKSAKGSTIEEDVVIVGGNLNKKNLYTAVTRTKKKVYSTVRCNECCVAEKGIGEINK